MLSPFINHLLVQENWASEQLQAHAGKVVCIDAQAIRFCLRVRPDGLFEAAAEPVTATVTIRLRLSDLPLMLSQRERAFSYVNIEGDADFANMLSRLSQNLRWDAEADLSKLIGDVAAVRLVAGAKTAASDWFEAQQKLHENIAEYFLEENPLLVRPARVASNGALINKTRDDVERLTKRIEKLERMSR